MKKYGNILSANSGLWFSKILEGHSALKEELWDAFLSWAESHGAQGLEQVCLSCHRKPHSKYGSFPK